MENLWILHLWKCPKPGWMSFPNPNLSVIAHCDKSVGAGGLGCGWAALTTPGVFSSLQVPVMSVIIVFYQM